MKAFALASLLLLSVPALALEPVRWAQASVKITRSYVDWTDPHGRIRYETVCEARLAVPVYDVRENPSQRPEEVPASLRCPSQYREENVPVLVRGRVELVPAEEFQLPLPQGSAVKRTFFTLEVDVGEGFPYLQEVQALTGWQLFTEDLSLRSQIFSLSPEAFLQVHCADGQCWAPGPQAIFRAQVILHDAP